MANTNNGNAEVRNGSGTDTANGGVGTVTRKKKNGALDAYIQQNDLYREKKEFLQKEHQDQTAGIEQKKNDQLQASAIAQQKLLKYLPEYNSAMGLRGSGASETALLDANARYRSAQGQIAASYDAQRSDADRDYRQNMLSLYAEARSAQQNEYETAFNTVADWSGSSEELDRYMKELRSKLTDEQYQSLNNQYQSTRETVVKDEKQQTYRITDITGKNITLDGVNDDSDAGKNFKITVSGETYKVQLGGKNADSGVAQAAENGEVQAGSVFLYRGELYYYKGNGDIFRVEKRTLSNAEDNDYNRVLGVLGGGTGGTSSSATGTASSGTSSGTSSGVKKTSAADITASYTGTAPSNLYTVGQTKPPSGVTVGDFSGIVARPDLVLTPQQRERLALYRKVEEQAK